MPKGMEIDALTQGGRSALHQAALDGNLAEARKLIAKGAKIDNHSDVGSPLYFAVDEGHLEVVKLLVEHGADVNLANGIGDLPLETAFSNFESVFSPEDKTKYQAVIDYLKGKGARRK